MATAPDTRAVAALQRGRTLKKFNAVTALVCGAVPGLILSRLLYPYPSSLRLWLVGIAAGLLWANTFEYCYHRFLLHWPKSSFGKGHLQHHLTLGLPEEAEHLPFGSSPLLVAAVFAVNGAIAVAAECWLRMGIAPGILGGFSLYMIIVEEIHWRIHLGGWLPTGLNWTRQYHLAHHDIPSGRFNVFFPVFDLLLAISSLDCGRPEPGRWMRRCVPVQAKHQAGRQDSSMQRCTSGCWGLPLALVIFGNRKSALLGSKIARLDQSFFLFSGR